MVIDGVNVDAAIVNGGGIRASIPEGTVTLGSISRAVPYNNVLYVMTLKGRDLLELIEAATCATPRAIGAFPQVAGMKYTVDTRVPYEIGRQYPASTYFAPKNLGSRVDVPRRHGRIRRPRRRRLRPLRRARRHHDGQHRLRRQRCHPELSQRSAGGQSAGQLSHGTRTDYDTGVRI